MSKRKLPQNESNVNGDFCEFLHELADYEKNVNRNIHKYNAYRQAAETLSNEQTRITSGKEAKKLPGIGEKIAAKIDEFISTGKLQKLEKIKNDDTSTAISFLTRVSGIGPAKARELVDSGVKTLQDLEKCKDNLNHHQLIGLNHFHDFEKRIPRTEIKEIERIIRQELAELDDQYLVEICGSYRRGKDTSGDVDCLLTHPALTAKSLQGKKRKGEGHLLKRAVLALEGCGLLVDTLALGETKFMGVCRVCSTTPARRLDLRLTPHDQYHCAVLYFTGSDLFNKNMRTHALDRGFTLNEYCLRPVGLTGTPGEPVPVASEREIFEYLDYPYKEPHERDS